MGWFRKRTSNIREKRYLSTMASLEELTSVSTHPELGRNVVAKKSIPAGTLLGVYPGVKIGIIDYLDKHEFLDHSLKYCYKISKDLVIDPTDIFGYLPDLPALRLAIVNEAPLGVKTNVIPLTSENNVWYVTLDDIKADEALYTYYGPNYIRNYDTSVSQTPNGIELSDKEAALLKDLKVSYCWLDSGISKLLENYYNIK